MHVTTPTRGMSAELARYMQAEYNANASSARTMLGRANGARSARFPNGAGGLLRRFLATVSEAFASARASPGGA